MHRVLLLIKGLGRGGAEQLLVNAASYLDRGRYDYQVAYVLPWKDSHVAALEELGVRVNCLNGGRGAGWVMRLRRLVADRDVDLVHIHSPYAGIGARLALGWNGRPVLVSTEHVSWDSYHRMTYWANALTFPRNAHVFAVSDDVRRSVRYPAALRFLPMPPVETLYHGLDPLAQPPPAVPGSARSELRIPPTAPLVVNVANFKTHKGHRYLLEAAVRVRRELPDVRFVLVGRGPLEDHVRHQVRRLRLDDTVIFAGYREDVHRVVADADVFALSSLYEGLSIALIEALAQGKPAVVTDATGLAEVVEHGREGLVVPTRDPEALGDALVRVLRDPRLQRRLGEAGPRRALQFDIREAVRRWEEVYAAILASAFPQPRLQR